MPRKKKLSPAEQAQRETEALNSSVRIDGAGEHPVVKALLSPEFEQMSNMDVSGIALVLQEIVRGQNSLLARYDETSIEIARLRERQDQADREIAERLAGQQKFIEEILDRAESLKRTGLEHDKLIAEGVAIYEKAKHTAAAQIASSNLAFEQKLASEEKVMVVSPGQLITTMEGGQQVAKIIAEEVRIKHKVWIFPPGIPVFVPKTIADFLAQRRSSQIKTNKLQDILSKKLEASKLAEEWNKIGETDAMPTTA